MTPAEREEGIRFVDHVWPTWREDVPSDQHDDVIERHRGSMTFACWRLAHAMRNVGQAYADAFADVARRIRKERPE